MKAKRFPGWRTPLGNETTHCMIKANEKVWLFHKSTHAGPAKPPFFNGSRSKKKITLPKIEIREAED